jgi:hypothetical protein
MRHQSGRSQTGQGSLGVTFRQFLADFFAPSNGSASLVKFVTLTSPVPCPCRPLAFF